jgi:hypothetical protein
VSRGAILISLALATSVAFGASADTWTTALEGPDVKGALARIFGNDGVGFRSGRCQEHGSAIRYGYDRRTTVYYTCRLSVDAKALLRMLSDIKRPITIESVGRADKLVCPSGEAFAAARVYVTSKSLAEWDINDTAIYVNSQNTELLACHKVLILP